MGDRNAKLDNIKGILIILVVFGHYLDLNQGWNNNLSQFLLSSIYLFHMPAFSFAAGITTNPSKSKLRAKELFFLFIVVNFAYLLPTLLSGNIKLYNFVVPQQGMWFLLSLSVWVALSPVIIKSKRAIFVSAILALMVGLLPTNGYYFNISRTSVFFFFFVMGIFYGNYALKLHRYSGILSILCLCLFAAIHLFGIDYSILLGAYTFSQAGISNINGMVDRIVVMASATLCIIALFSVTRNNNTFLSLLGRRSLSIFIAHFIFIKLASPLFVHFNISGILSIGLSIMLTIPTLILCQSTPFLVALDKIRALIQRAIK